MLHRRTSRSLLPFVLLGAFGCADRVCLVLADRDAACPSQSAASDLFRNDCGTSNVQSIDGPGERDGGACCYDATTGDDDNDFGGLCTVVPPSPTGGSGSGGAGAAGGSGAAGGAGGTLGDWSCLGSVPSLETSADLDLAEIGVYDHFTLAAYGDANIRVCAHEDPACQAPFDEAVTNRFGLTTLLVPRSGPVYYEASPQTPAPRTIHYEFSLPASDPFSLSVRPVSAAVLSELRQLAGMVPDPSTGDVFVREISDCSGLPATGVVLDLVPANGQFVYVANGAFDFGAWVANEGQAIALGIPAGPHSVWASVAATGQVLGPFEISVQPSTLTTLRLEPIPTPI